ncbi:uncharacterized protein PHALS_02019 [Plasmopara halstedii]|uniref:Uncharacterized protein n=1 Tax=Plasmopara halstedii TaxID=4781 RepID=A0A0P1AW45_PLAHL|nr:uncharacterized protein PHALS_02019 [Plasmopara halstedii]CEG45742.1 hypothetical protein PHALS_02019 [Plasmopara halstedii]|eukprot:XP_024582111.1 hypothetical protein PHALS_02019 [Plasmopara halstedii]
MVKSRLQAKFVSKLRRLSELRHTYVLLTTFTYAVCSANTKEPIVVMIETVC